VTRAPAIVADPARVVVIGTPLPPRALDAVDPGQVTHAERIDVDRGWRPCDVVVLRWDDPARDEAWLDGFAHLPASRRPHLVVAGDAVDGALRALLERHELAHVIGTRGPTAAGDLAVTLDKLLSRDLFGLDRYVGHDLAPARFVSRGSVNRGALFDWLTMYAEPRGIKRRILDLLLVVADELVTNAFYNAPTDAHGHHVYADRPRSEPITLDAPLEVSVELRCDGTRFGIAVPDPFGSLPAPVRPASPRPCLHAPRPAPVGVGRGSACTCCSRRCRA